MPIEKGVILLSQSALTFVRQQIITQGNSSQRECYHVPQLLVCNQIGTDFFPTAPELIVTEILWIVIEHFLKSPN
jgi:hypothetical protein